MFRRGKIVPAMTEMFHQKCLEIQKKFALLSAEERYQLLIEMGRRLPPYPNFLKNPQNIVSGCQSTLYLHCDFTDGKLFFQAQSDALISAGLAALLLHLYSGESPETILQHPPSFLATLSLALSPSRSHGLTQLHRRIQHHALLKLNAKC
jgi:cysteine desulfuration protein SufE